ncbi:hypothetical protein AMS68_003656 [Peltaster fructicola]|uniref:Uncharacterized protein n=1 Tax=Peltaster fructicola TaxID=286661 RepID=A0A6H0XU43_9PEZI|nr:hypothetical protein AMS68_003656 [Peltaster fructicola]
MPPNTSSGVFGRFRRQTQTEREVQEIEVSEGPRYIDESAAPQSPTERRLKEHHRDNSLRSLSSSVSDFRRSVSLRSHHSQLSGGGSTAAAQRVQRNHSSGNLLLHSPPILEPSASPTPPSPPRHRSKLSFSTRPFSRSLKSSEALPLFESEIVPDVPTLADKKQFSMLNVAPFNRPAGEQQYFASQVSLPRIPQSSHGADPGFGPPPPSSHGPQNPQAIYQQIQETALKRVSTIQYIRRLHEGDVFFFNTLHVSQSGLSSMPSFQPQKMGRRATSYFHLGHSLPVILDMKSSSPLEYLKPVSALLQEFETYQSLAGVDGSGSLSRRGMGAMLKSGMGLGKGAGKNYRRASTTDAFSDSASLNPPTTSHSATFPDLPSPGFAAGYEFSYLLTPQLPFDPDFMTAFSTLCDTLIEMYSTLLSLVTGPEACGIALAEAFSKADKSIRKILVSNVVKEFEEHTRSGAKAEVAGLSKLVLGGLM